MSKLIILVLDSVGVGELPDAANYNDTGSNTLANIAQVVGGLDLSHLEKMGLGNIIPIKGIKPQLKPMASFAKMAEISAGKDTQTGHWEMMGLVVKKPFPVFSNGFPKEIITKFEHLIGRRILGNIAASGTEIIAKLGQEHLDTGYPIVYTSADSVFQIAVHLDVITLKDLYRYCELARSLLVGKYSVARVIARPFTGRPGHFVRTPQRKDYTVKPFSKTALDYIKEAGFTVSAVGKISEIFSGRGITKAFHTDNNKEGLGVTLELMDKQKEGVIFTNLVDFDMLWGHRNDPCGYYKGLLEVDAAMPQVINNLGEKDCLIITADHGCDPTIKTSTDHSREYVPMLCYGKRLNGGIDLGIRKSFADIGRTAIDMFGIKADIFGASFFKEIKVG
ncbi:MAG: phosphopentomutase [Actinobacteria bacterium]|nr:MAG: phosphopentomutase [Actinomycetota bacterium]